MKWPQLLLLLLFLGSSSLASEPIEKLDSEEIASLLERCIKKQKATAGFNAEFKETRHKRVLKKPLNSSGEFWFSPPTKLRRESQGASSSVMISDGSELVLYYPDQSKAERYPLDSNNRVSGFLQVLLSSMRFSELAQNFEITATRNDRLTTLQLSPKQRKMQRALDRLYITLDNSLNIVRTDVSLANGDKIATVYSNHKNAAIPDSRFHTDLPQGTEIIEVNAP